MKEAIKHGRSATTITIHIGYPSAGALLRFILTRITLCKPFGVSLQ